MHTDVSLGFLHHLFVLYETKTYLDYKFPWIPQCRYLRTSNFRMSKTYHRMAWSNLFGTYGRKPDIESDGRISKLGCFFNFSRSFF